MDLMRTPHPSLSAMLDALDRNKDGIISATELHQGLASIGFHLEAGQLRQIVRLADQNNDGRLSRAELERTTPTWGYLTRF